MCGRQPRFSSRKCFNISGVHKDLQKKIYSVCDVILHQPDLLTCIGCAGIYHFAEVLPGSTYFARSTGKGHQDWIGHGNSYYYFSPDKKNWNDSLAACRKLGSDLAEVNDATEKKFLVLNNNDRRKHKVFLSQLIIKCLKSGLEYYIPYFTVNR
ncbi:uncharacterized protein LOC123560072 [Mercenaria mercenaria]|uniref:uncharacterized protein LOC123560072 n=1 Tax=Mercenaria mercenaria TaxID=6596 RepID=UPI00234F3BAA|nr:uncharacterized protein LOC123560072 [Mercenaria mercenaria]